MTMNRYESYQDSGIPWLGEVPAHWGTWKITHAIDLIGSGTTPKSDNTDYYDGEILWVTTSELRENFIDDTKQKITDYAIQNYSALKIYPKNSVAIAMYGATIGRLGILSKDATFNQACCVFGNSKKLHYKFLFYWLWYRRPILISLSNGGGQPNLSQDDLKKLKIPLPPLPEQTAIADYLDNKLGEIDALISKQETLLEKLAEQRTAIITHAVTKGLNAHAPMKNSGVAWLGDVPEHWEIKRLKNSTISTQNGIWGDEAKYDDNDVYCIRVADFNRHQFTININKGDLTVRNISNKDYENRKLFMGDLLLEKSGGGEKQPVGFAVFNTFNGKAVCSNFIARVQLASNMNSKYWTYFHSLLYSARVNIRSIKQSTGIQNLDATLYFNELACYPPLPEQTAIANYLDDQTSKIDRLSDTINQTIARLKEYRSALITQAVTGKIKVI